MGVFVALGIADQDRVILRSVKTNGNFGIQIHVVTQPLDNACVPDYGWNMYMYVAKFIC